MCGRSVWCFEMYLRRFWARHWRSPSTACAIIRQTLASGLLGAVAQLTPPSAVRSSDKQSVRMAGAIGHMDKTTCNAQASAAAAVRHQCGGEPRPYPSKSPSTLTTAIPKPVDLYVFHRPCNIDPSKYQRASSMLELRWSGSTNH